MSNKQYFFRQEAPSGIYQMMWPFIAATQTMRHYYPKTFGKAWGYFKDGYVVILCEAQNMQKAAENVRDYYDKGRLSRLYSGWKKLDQKITNFSHKISKLDLLKLSDNDLEKQYRVIKSMHQDMWNMSIAIDTLDVGLDSTIIAEAVKKYGFNAKELEILLSPTTPSYINVIENNLYKIKQGKLSAEKFIEKYFWLGTNYEVFSEISKNQVIGRAKKTQFTKFVNLRRKQSAILVKYGLKKNPLVFLQLLTQWRDERKRANYTGLYGLMRLLKAALKRKRVPVSYLTVLLPDEADALISGNPKSPSEIGKRKTESVLVTFLPGSCKYTLGETAEKAFSELNNRFYAEQAEEIVGTIASKGVATGRVKVINNPIREHKKMKRGDILVTSMTRPEFLSLMKLAAGIVTDEGGITSHAAIVSRELGIPCIIGTKIARKVLKDGDVVEVDANKGIVRKI